MNCNDDCNCNGTCEDDHKMEEINLIMGEVARLYAWLEAVMILIGNDDDIWTDPSNTDLIDCAALLETLERRSSMLRSRINALINNTDEPEGATPPDTEKVNWEFLNSEINKLKQFSMENKTKFDKATLRPEQNIIGTPRLSRDFVISQMQPPVKE